MAYGIGTDAQYKRGVLFLDDMEYATPYVVTGTGADFSCDVQAAAKCFGIKGLRLATRTTNPAEDDIVTAAIQICYPETNKMVCRMRVGITDVSDTKDFQVALTVKDGANEYKAAIKYDQEVQKLYYWGSAGSWVEISGYAFTISDTFWSILEFSIDLGSHEYLSVLYEGVETSLADVAIQTVGVSTDRSVLLELVDTALTNQISYVFVDSLYVGEFSEL